MKSRFHAAAVTAMAAFCIIAPGVAQPQKPALKPLDVFDLQWVADPQISPDGRSIAYVRMGFDIKTDRARGTIWLVGVDGKNERPLSSAPSSAAPRWSPDGTRIAYLARAADGSTQLFMYWTASGATAAISNFTESPGGLAWSPDGRWLAFTMPVAAEHKPLKVELPEAPKNAHWADPPKLIDKMVFRADGEGYLPNAFNQLFIVAADGGAARQLTHGDFDHEGPPSFTADGTAQCSSARIAAPMLSSTPSTVRFTASNCPTSPCMHSPTGAGRIDIRWRLPDGKHIAYLGFDDKQLGYQAVQLYVMDSDGSHAHSLTASLDRDVVVAAVERRRQAADLRIWRSRIEQDRRHRSCGQDARAGRWSSGGADVTRPYSGGSFSISERTGASRTPRPAHRPLAALATGTSLRDVTTLTALSGTLLGQRTFGAARRNRIRFRGRSAAHAGLDRQAAAVRSGEEIPLRAGNPRRSVRELRASFAAEIQLYAAAGYVVLYMNPRGSTGYGEQFANLIHHDYPDKDYDDLMSGVDAVVGRGYIDTQRLFVTGGSGGGVLTAWIVGHTDRFRAAVVVKPVINWTSFVLTGDMNNYFYRYWFGEFPWENMQAYWRRSPLAYVGNVHTPTMLMTGEADYRTPSSEAEQFYQALKLRKVDTALVRVPNASHDISARPSLLIAKVAYVLAWLKTHDVKTP